MRVRMDIPNIDLNSNIKEALKSINYFSKFEVVEIKTSYKPKFIFGEYEDYIIRIYINPEDKRAKNKYLIKGYFLRTIFLLINEREKINEYIRTKSPSVTLTNLLLTMFSDRRCIIYGASKIFKDFYLLLFSEKVYSNREITRLEYIELFTYYLNFKDKPFCREFLELLGKLNLSFNTSEIKGIIYSLGKLNYPRELINDLLIKEWKRLKL